MMRYIFVTLGFLVLTGCSESPPNPAHMAPMASVAVIGDSYTGGSGEGGLRERGWPILVAEKLERQGLPITPDLGTAGGSGYVNRGPRNTVFAEQIPDAVGLDDRVVVLFGSRNDRGVPSDVLAAAVRNTLVDVQIAAPTAGILVIGPPWIGAPSAEILEVRDVVRSQAEAAGATFVDPIAEAWFEGQPELIGSDGFHPTDAGHVYMAEKIAPLIAEQLTAEGKRSA